MPNVSKGIFNTCIDPPSLLEDVDSASQELGKGRFGAVLLKKFQLSPVHIAVKYSDMSVRAQLVEREAFLLSHHCHIYLLSYSLLLCYHVQLSPFYKVVFFLYLQKCILKINDGKKFPSSGLTIIVNEIDSLELRN